MNENIEERNKSFLRECRRVILSGVIVPGTEDYIGQVVGLALQSAPPCYFVGIDRASANVRRVIEGGTAYRRCSVRRQMWTELADRVSARMREHGAGYSRALSYTLNFVRPSRYFISEQSARRLLHNALKSNPAYFSRMKPQESAKYRRRAS